MIVELNKTKEKNKRVNIESQKIYWYVRKETRTDESGHLMSAIQIESIGRLLVHNQLIVNKVETVRFGLVRILNHLFH